MVVFGGLVILRERRFRFCFKRVGEIWAQIVGVLLSKAVQRAGLVSLGLSRVVLFGPLEGKIPFRRSLGFVSV